MNAQALRQASFALVWLFAVDPWLAAVLPGHQTTEAAKKEAPPPPRRYRFDIDPKTPLLELLPARPLPPLKVAPWLDDDLSKVPEIRFEKVVPKPLKPPADLDKLPKEEQAHFRDLQAKMLDRAHGRIAHGIAKINHLNKEGTDNFLKTLLKHRSDLAGLPFVMGDACRTDKKAAQQFVVEVELVRGALEREPKTALRVFDLEADAKRFWEGYRDSSEADRKADPALRTRMSTAALMQMLAPMPLEFRLPLVKHLAERDATDALTQLAIFSPEKEVRDAALEALKARRVRVDAQALLRGVRYPWPAIAQNAARAIVTLERGDLIGDMLEILDEPDPRAPLLREGKYTLREVVRLNHHHNCLLCHAPGNTPDLEVDFLSRPVGIVTGAVPSPDHPLPAPSSGYNRNTSPDILVRVDVSYLRQDFSLLQPVKDAEPWPEMQRFDFLVRTREVSGFHAEQYADWRGKQGADYLPPNQDAALFALRGLTGRDAGRTSAAWRRELGL